MYIKNWINKVSDKKENSQYTLNTKQIRQILNESGI